MIDNIEIPRFLLRKGLIEAGDIVDRGITVVEHSRRNRGARVSIDNVPRFFVKQGGHSDGELTVGCEANFYSRLSGTSCTALRSFVPDFVAWDETDGVLVLEHVPNCETLADYHHRRGRISPEIAETLGIALATLHHAPASVLTGPTHPPWIFGIAEPAIEMVRETSLANAELLRVIQRVGGFTHWLDGLRTEWLMCEPRPVHYDVKWDNCLIARPFTRAEGGTLLTHATVRLIDWELHSVGNASWDVGSLLADFIAHWVRSVPIIDAKQPARHLDLARSPLTKMQPAILAFWLAYARRMEWDPAETERQLVVAVRHSAARLVQTAFESLQDAAQLSAVAVCLLQIASNLFNYPGLGATQLFGIPWSDG